MNKLSGSIHSIQSGGNLSLVKIKVGQLTLTTIIIDTPDTVDYLKLKNPINVIFKETEVIIGKEKKTGVSLQNKIPGIVKKIELGELLSKIELDTAVGKITSIITSNAVEQLQIHKGSNVVAMIKTNELMLSK